MKIEIKINGKSEQELVYKRNQLEMAIKVHENQIKLLEKQIEEIDIQLDTISDIECWRIENER